MTEEIKKACEHMWALYKIVTKKPETQDYKCIHCGEIKRGLRS